MVNQSLKDHAFNRCLSHTCLGHGAIFTRLVEEASLEKRNGICRSLEMGMCVV